MAKRNGEQAKDCTLEDLVGRIVRSEAVVPYANRGVTVDGRKTTVRLEPSSWQALREIAEREKTTVNVLATMIDRHRPKTASLSSAIRVFVTSYYRSLLRISTQ